jgi:alpha-tubulin suppressor-like RCC1 family protein
MALKNNTWKLNQWYDQNVAGNVSYSGLPILYALGGDNNYGQLGLNDKVLRSSPTQVPGTTWDGDNIRYVGDHAVLRKTDGTLWSVGSAGWGKLGLNDESTDQSSPTQIPGTTWSTVASIDAGQISAATKTDGTLWVWGKNNYGVMGQNQAYSGPAKGRSSPTQIPGTTWSSASAAPSQVNAIKTDGTLWTWGDNSNGRHGLNTPQFANYSSPVQLPGTWTKTIVTSSGACFGWKSDTELWSWGYHGRGTIGQGNYQSISSPVQIPGDWPSGVGKFSGFYRGAAAVKSDGTLWVWGWNNKGQVGDNSTIARSSPTQVPGTTWSQVGSGNYQTLATKTDNTLWGWGLNSQGQLGINDNVSYSSPVQVPGTIWSGPVNAGMNVSSVIAQL